MALIAAINKLLLNCSHTALIALTIVFILIANAALNYLRDRRKYPPGPSGVPIFGYMPFMGKFPHLKFIQLVSARQFTNCVLIVFLAG